MRPARIAAVLGLGLELLSRAAAAQTASVLVEASVAPPSARLCASPAGDSAATPACGPCEAGACRVVIPEGWKDADLRVEVSAADHFSEMRVGHAGEGMEFRLVSHPWIDWKGWSGGAGPEVDMEWLLADRSEAWRPLGKKIGRGTRFLPGDARALRLTPGGGASPVTLFPPAARAPFGTQGPIPARPGGEVALCLEMENERRPAADVPLVAHGEKTSETKRTNGLGCVAFPGLRAGLVTVEVGSESRLRLEPTTVRIAAGRSEWLGTLHVSIPAALTIRIEDPDPTHVYAARAEAPFASDPSARAENASLTSARPVVWTLSPGEYLVWIRPTFVTASEVLETVSIRSGEDQTILLRPRFTRLSGRVLRGERALPDSPLHFLREEDSGREHKLDVRSDREGRYVAVLGAAGRWRVSLKEKDEPNGSAQPVRIEVSDEPEAEKDLIFPNGEVSGSLLDRKTGKPSGIPSIRIRGTPLPADGTESKEFDLDVPADREGRFRVGALPDSRVSVEIRDELAVLFRVRPVAAVAIEVRGESPQTVDLKTDPLEDGAKLKVTDRAGAPVAGAQALLADSDRAPGTLLGRSDDEGEIVLPKDLAAQTPIYVICAGHPWAKTFSPAESEDARTVRLDDPRREPTVIQFEPIEGKPPREIRWGLTDSSGQEVPVFFHLLRQGIYPVAQGGQATLPQPGEGEYVLWVKGDHDFHALGRIILPAAAPVVMSLKPCGTDCPAP